MTAHPQNTDLAIIGAGAAGLMAAICAGRAARESNRPLRIVALDGARTLGAKILVSGGGRCNVTHSHWFPHDYAGDSYHSIRKVIWAYPIEETIRFFQELGVALKEEDTGKLFPVTDSARTVLNALLDECRRLRVEIVHPWRVESIAATEHGFRITSTTGEVLEARKAILATGGKALPKSGSDGQGYSLARTLGHTITPEVFPALAALKLDQEQTTICQLSGIATPAQFTVCSSTGKVIQQGLADDTLITHFGLSGPAAMNISRHWTAARLKDPGAGLFVDWAPYSKESFENRIIHGGKRSIRRVAPVGIATRLLKWMCEQVGVDISSPASNLDRIQRKQLVQYLHAWRAPVTGDRGFTHAEATAGGIPLKEVHLTTMLSRKCPHLYLCGEILNVDGRIGGFNFQWAWSSGYLAGRSAARTLAMPEGSP